MFRSNLSIASNVKGIKRVKIKFTVWSPMQAGSNSLIAFFKIPTTSIADQFSWTYKHVGNILSTTSPFQLELANIAPQ